MAPTLTLTPSPPPLCFFFSLPASFLRRVCPLVRPRWSFISRANLIFTSFVGRLFFRAERIPKTRAEEIRSLQGFYLWQSEAPPQMFRSRLEFVVFFFCVYFENCVFTAAPEPKADNLDACFGADKGLMFYLLEQTAAD